MVFQKKPLNFSSLLCLNEFDIFANWRCKNSVIGITGLVKKGHLQIRKNNQNMGHRYRYIHQEYIPKNV
jgi:hypothetical protein